MYALIKITSLFVFGIKTHVFTLCILIPKLIMWYINIIYIIYQNDSKIKISHTIFHPKFQIQDGSLRF